MEKISLEIFKDYIRQKHFTTGVQTNKTYDEQKSFIESVPLSVLERIRATNKHRTIKTEHKTYFEFTDSSRLSFDVGNKYYKHNDILIVQSENYFWITYLIA